MLNNLRSFSLLAAIAACSLIFVAQAGAADKFYYDVQVEPANGPVSGNGRVTVTGLDKSKSTTVRVLRAAVQQYTGSIGTNVADYITLYAANLAPGDQIEVQQPSGSVQETYTVPSISISGSAGSPVVTGTAPAGSVAYASYYPVCDLGYADDQIDAPVIGTTLSATLPAPAEAGQRLVARVFPGKGDELRYETRVAGETPCFDVNAFAYPGNIAGPPDPKPFSVSIEDLNPAVSPSARMVLRRGGSIIVDYSAAGNPSSLYDETATQPLAGDVLELYRPQGAGSPVATFTVPSAASVYDVSNSLVAVDAPAASWVSSDAGAKFAMWSNERTALNTQSGRTILNYGVSEGFDGPVNLSFVDWLRITWGSRPLHGTYEFAPAPGDLAAPVVAVKLAGKFKLAKLRSSLPLTVTLNEPATVSMKLTLPSKLAAAARKPQTLASKTLALGTGASKVKLKFSRSGKKLIKKLRGRRYGTQKATLTVISTDPSGNVTTTVKTTKLAK